MASQQDIEYYIRREAQERAMAEAAQYPAAQAIHTELADRYAAFLAEEEERGASSFGEATSN